MKFAITVLAALACGTAFAQAPAAVSPRPPQELNPNLSGGKAQAKGEMNAEAKGKGTAMGGATASTAVMGSNTMDANGDGMISRTEWNAYHGRTWSGMKANKQGMVPWADVQGAMGGMGGTPK